MIKSFVYTRKNDFYKNLSESERKRFVESVKVFLDSDSRFIKCTHYNKSRISGYRIKYPGE